MKKNIILITGVFVFLIITLPARTIAKDISFDINSAPLEWEFSSTDKSNQYQKLEVKTSLNIATARFHKIGSTTGLEGGKIKWTVEDKEWNYPVKINFQAADIYRLGDYYKLRILDIIKYTQEIEFLDKKILGFGLKSTTEQLNINEDKAKVDILSLPVTLRSRQQLPLNFEFLTNISVFPIGYYDLESNQEDTQVYQDDDLLQGYDFNLELRWQIVKGIFINAGYVNEIYNGTNYVSSFEGVYCGVAMKGEI